MVIAEPKLPPLIGYVEDELDGVRVYREMGSGKIKYPDEPEYASYTGLEQAQQEVTDRELEAIALGQTVTDLELSCLEQGRALDMMLLGGHTDV